jgi:uncharacterized protein
VAGGRTSTNLILTLDASDTLREPKGATVKNPIVYFEIGTRDQAAVASFYDQLFEWNISERDGSLRVDTTADGDEGINGHLTALGHEPHNYTIFYVRVDDIVSTIADAQRLGGTLLVGPIPIPVGQFAWISDPEGNTVGLLQH